MKVPFVMVTDEAYPLLPYLMRPYPKRIVDGPKQVYNYCLSRARRSVKCAFGILCSKWCILLKAIETDVSNAIHIVKAVCILRNFVQQYEPFHPENDENLITKFGNRLCSSRRTQYRFSEKPKEVQENFLHFFIGIGSVPWQNNYLH
jgi:hypothetical protein